MKYVFKAHEMKAYDRDTSDRIGIPSMVLMERAALAAVEVILRKGHVPGKVLIAAGCGNNGGDGLAIGRLLAFKGSEVVFFMAGNQAKMSVETKAQAAILKNSGFSIQSNFEMKEYDMVIDALFGIGLSRNVEGIYYDVIEKINACGRRGAVILSVDIPSGICADTGSILGSAVRADLTVSFAFAKRGHLLYPGREYTGELIVKDIGITRQSFGKEPPAAFCYERSDVAELLPKRRPDGNKGTFGKVLLLSGCQDMGGACILCGRSILKTGAGMVKIITPSCNREILQNAVPEAMLYTFDEEPDKEKLEKSIDWADVIVAGPGMGMKKSAYQLLKYILEEAAGPLVLDADALNLIAAHENLRMLAAGYGTGRLVITPHPGELARLTGTLIEEYQKHREELVYALAKELHCVVAAKDAVTMVAQDGKREVYINTSGNDAMAGAGSGDVLAGIIGGLLAQKKEIFDAACLGVYLHGLAGEEASLKEGRYGMTASDMLNKLSFVMREA